MGICVLLPVILLTIGALTVDGELIPHDPIAIDGDGGFTEENGVTGGNGSISNPFAIEGYRINITSGSGVSVANVTKQFVVRNMAIHGDGTWYSNGVLVMRVVGGQVENVTISRTFNGIHLSGTTGLIISNNTVINADVGVYSYYGRDDRFLGNVLVGTPGTHLMDVGIQVSFGLGSIIDGNSMSGGVFCGIYLFDGVGQRLSNNSIHGFGASGIRFHGDMADFGAWNTGQVFIKGCIIGDTPVGIDMFQCRVNIEESHFENIGSYGIYVVKWPAAFILGNSFRNTSNPIWMDGPIGARIESNTILAGDTPGLTAQNSNLLIKDNRISDRTVGILLRPPLGGQLFGNELEGNGIGIHIQNTGHVNISMNRVVNSTMVGILLQGSDNCTLTSNLISGASVGMVLVSTTDVTVYHDTIRDCQAEAVRVTSGHGITFHHNNFIKNNYQASSGTYIGPQALDDTALDAWDDGREGNYWSDYELRYPGAQSNGRVWDTPYDIAGSGVRRDRYPLAEVMDLLPPVAEAGPDRTVDQNTTVPLDGSASTDDIGIVDFAWSFTYGGTVVDLSGEIAEFTFDLPGTYEAKLTVRDREGRTSSDTVTITVLDTQPPVAIPGEDVSVGMGRRFILDGSASWDNVAVVTFTWTVDPDGLNLTCREPIMSLDIDAQGEYEAILRVADAAGNAGLGRLVIHVLDTEPPVARASEDVCVDQGTTVTFDGTGSSDNVAVTNWTWHLHSGGEDIVLSGAVVSFNFAEPGPYDVALLVMDAQGNSDQDIVRVRARDILPPVAVAGDNLEVDQGVEVLLSGLASHDNVGIAGYVWSFSDDDGAHVLREAETLVTLQGVGEHEVVLTVVDLEGNVGSDTLIVTVRDATPPVAEAGGDLTVDQGGLVGFDGSASRDNVGITGYMWMLLEADVLLTLQGETCSRTFDHPGIYRVTLLVNDKAGNAGTDDLLLTVLDTESPTADAGPDRVVVEGGEITLDGTGSRDNVGIAGYRWTVGNATGMGDVIGPMPTLEFNMPGDYIVTLEVADTAGNVATDMLSVRVLPLRIPWRIGPFVDKFGHPVPDTTVTVLLNGTTGLGRTDADGWVNLTVVRFDLVSPASVSARKDGWKPLDFNIRLDEAGRPLDPIPPMEQEAVVRTGPSTLTCALMTLVLAAAAACVVWEVWRNRERRMKR